MPMMHKSSKQQEGRSPHSFPKSCSKVSATVVAKVMLHNHVTELEFRVSIPSQIHKDIDAHGRESVHVRFCTRATYHVHLGSRA